MRRLQEFLSTPGNTAWMLGSILLALILVPFVERLPQSRAAVDVGLTLIVVFAVAAIWRRRLWRMPVLGLALLTIPTTWVSLFVDSHPLFVCQCVCVSCFFWFAGATVLLLSIRHRFTTLDAVLGAISAYLMFGLGWAYIYWAIDVAVPGSFCWPTHVDLGSGYPNSTGVFSELVYYSMVTMSTLGYGDITPIGGFARTMSWMQSVAGQFYVAVVIAWLVSALPRDTALTHDQKNAS
jgi:voltage-gated potassium channel